MSVVIALYFCLALLALGNCGTAETQAMSVIRKGGEPPLGIRFWAQTYMYRTPRYEVFRYYGTDYTTGHYWFESLTEKTLISRSLEQLNQSGFRPFLLNMERIDAFLMQHKEG
jgi:hypothetical protein